MRKAEMNLFRETALAIARRGSELTVSQLAKRIGASYNTGKALMNEFVRKRIARKTGKRDFGGGEIRGSGVAYVYQLRARDGSGVTPGGIFK